ncbi:MFS transporter [Rhodococcus sp. C26F]
MEEPYPRRWGALTVLCLSLLVVVMANTSLMVAAPAMTKDLALSSRDLQWVIDGYTVPYAALMLVLGAVGDKVSRRGALWVGLAVFTAGSLWGSIADETMHVIIARAVMGVGAALIMPATLSLLVASFPRTERARAITIWTATSGLAIAFGPLFAGALLEHYSWESTFLINVPITVVAALAALFLVPPSKADDADRPDVLGAILSVMAIGALVYAIIEGSHFGWSTGPVVAAVVAAVALVAFVLWERWTGAPMLDVRKFHDRTFTGATLAVLLFFFAVFGAIYYVAQYLQFILGFGAWDTGVRLLPLAGAVFLGAFLTGKVTPRFGVRVSVGTGLGLGALGVLSMSRIDTNASYLDFVPALVLLGVAIGLAVAPCTDAIMGVFPEDRLGIGGGVNDTAIELGGSLGIAILGSVLATAFTTNIDEFVNTMQDRSAQLPPGQMDRAAEATRESVGGAAIVTEQLQQGADQLAATPAGGMQAQILTAQADALSTASTDAFSAAVSHTSTVAGMILAIGAITVIVIFPRSSQRTPERHAVRTVK